MYLWQDCFWNPEGYCLAGEAWTPDFLWLESMCKYPENPLVANTVPSQVLKNVSENLAWWPFSFSQKMGRQIETSIDTYETMWKETYSGVVTFCHRNLEKGEVTGAWLSQVAMCRLQSLPSHYILLLFSQGALPCLWKKQQKVQTSFLLLHLPIIIRTLCSLDQKAELQITVLHSEWLVWRWSHDPARPLKVAFILDLTGKKPFLSEHRSWSCLWQWEAELSKGVAHVVRRSEAYKERILTGLWNSVSESARRSVLSCPPGYVAP